MRLDPRNHLARHQLDLSSLVAQGPQVDALASRAGVARQEGGAVFGGADADLLTKLRISIQQGGEDLAIETSIALGTISLVNPRPASWRSAFGKAWFAAAALRVDSQTVDDLLRTAPASCCTRDASQPSSQLRR